MNEEGLGVTGLGAGVGARSEERRAKSEERRNKERGQVIHSCEYVDANMLAPPFLQCGSCVSPICILCASYIYLYITCLLPPAFWMCMKSSGASPCLYR